VTSISSKDKALLDKVVKDGPQVGKTFKGDHGAVLTIVERKSIPSNRGASPVAVEITYPDRAAVTEEYYDAVAAQCELLCRVGVSGDWEYSRKPNLTFWPWAAK